MHDIDCPLLLELCSLPILLRSKTKRNDTKRMSRMAQWAVLEFLNTNWRCIFRAIESQQRLHMCAFTVDIELILAIILVPVAILQHITILMNNVLPSQKCGGFINRFEMYPQSNWISSIAMDIDIKFEWFTSSSLAIGNEDKFHSHSTYRQQNVFAVNVQRM